MLCCSTLSKGVVAKMLSVITKIVYPIILTLIIIINTYNLAFFEIKKKNYLYLGGLIYLLNLFIEVTQLSDNATFIDIPILLLFIYHFTKNKYYSIIQVIFIIAIIGISDSLVGSLLFKSLNIDYLAIRQSEKLLILVQLAILFVSTLLSIFLKYILKDTDFSLMQEDSNNKISSSIVTLVIYIILLMVIVFLYVFLLTNQANNKSISHADFFVFTFTFVSFIFILLIVLVTNNAKNHIKQQYYNRELNQLNNYIKSIEDMSTDLRKFKHDYSNIILTLGEYVDTNDIEGLKDFYHNELLTESKDVLNQDQTLSSLKYITNTPLKSFISSKILQATSEKINVHIEIAEEIPQISMRILELCRVLGIFFDNAIEAAKLCDNKILNFAIINDEDKIIIVIQNSCGDDVPPIYKLFQENFSTKGTNRGLGLSNVNDIINKTHHRVTLNTTCKDNLFTQEVTIIKN